MNQKTKRASCAYDRALWLCPLWRLGRGRGSCALQMPGDVSRGGIQLSRGMGNQSGERAEGVRRGG